MGEVYLAYDDQLHRSVAIKTLPADLGEDQQRMHRFIQEARSASALNHPNILTIYEVGQGEGVHFIVTEYIDGKNLREHFRASDLKLGELLDVAIQISSALGKAHSSGIVHRDIKPENVMLTRDGYVKVLDFGLSKLTEQPLSTDPDALTQALINTEPGKVMGTTRYMSPEQARGLAVDARSDIWSLGVVLYEGLTGRAPFEGSTTTDLIVSILEREPVPITRFNPEVPQQLERIIRKTLAKDPDERYQVIKDLQIDLKNLKRELELEAEIDRTLPPEVRAAALSTKGSTQSQVDTILSPHSTTSPTKSVSSAEYVVTGLTKHKTAAIVTVGVILLMGAAVFFWLAKRTPALTDKDTILLADFTNTTGDAVFDGTLKQALAVQLGQSPYLSIAPDDSIRETLRFMNRSPDERITRDIAREICQRTGVKALLAGSISSLGSNYVVSLEAMNAQSGDVFAREQTEASRKEDVLKVLGTIASKLREKLGESLASIQKYDAPIEQATTSSLDALKSLSLGDEKRSNGKYEEAIPLYERAISLDQNFAVAYARLSVMYFNLREEEKTRQYAEKAFGLRDRVSEREKFYIESNYYQNVTGDIEKAIETLDLWRQTYPRDYVPQNNIAVNFGLLGEFEKQLAAGRESLRLNPNATSPYSNVSWAYLRLNRLDEASKTIEQAVAQNKVSFAIRGAMYVLAFLKNDANGMKQQTDWMVGKPFEPILSTWLASTQFSVGRLTEARISRKKGIDLALRKNQQDVAARLHLQSAGLEMLVGNCKGAIEDTKASLSEFRGRDQLSYGTVVFSSCGNAAEADSLKKEIDARYPNDTASARVILPVAEAITEMNKNNPSRAIEILEPVRRYELGEFGLLWPNYVRGLAYLNLGQPKDAVEEFQKILNHPAIGFFSELQPIGQLYLARAWALQARGGNPGNTSGSFSDLNALGLARKAYQDFLATWKDADADNPLFQQARNEYTQLQTQ